MTKSFGSLGNMIANSVINNFDTFKPHKKEVVNFLLTYTRKGWKDLRAYNLVFEALAQHTDRLTNIQSFEILRALHNVDLQKHDLEEFALGRFLESRAF